MKTPRKTSDKWDKVEVRRLFEEYAAHRDAELRDSLVAMHLNLARFIAAKFANRGEPIDDLQQVAALALVKAVERYDVHQGAEFTTFATPTIIGEIKRHFRDKSWAVKVPRRLQELKTAVSRITETLTTDQGRSPTIQEIARALHISDEEVLEAQELGHVYNLLSLNSEMDSEDDKKSSSLLDYLGRDDLSLQNVENQVALENALESLSGRERLVVSLRFYQGLSQSETARILGVSQMHVSRLQAKALLKLKHALTPPTEEPPPIG